MGFSGLLEDDEITLVIRLVVFFLACIGYINGGRLKVNCSTSDSGLGSVLSSKDQYLRSHVAFEQNNSSFKISNEPCTLSSRTRSPRSTDNSLPEVS